MPEKIIKRYISQKPVGQKVFRGYGGANDVISTWYDCEVEYTDGTRAVIREVAQTDRDTRSCLQSLPEVELND